MRFQAIARIRVDKRTFIERGEFFEREPDDWTTWALKAEVIREAALPVEDVAAHIDEEEDE